MPAADAYLVRRIHLEGHAVEKLAAVWGIEPAQLESSLGEMLAVLQKPKQ